jgi:2-polyprenyl-3-methyl-5-hydroxy-6-metoxy-1,4-benzoquinol methylase
METVDCILCGKSETRLAFAAKDRLAVTADPFSIVRCQRCGLLFLNPRPTQEEMGRYYPYSEYGDAFTPAIEDEPSVVTRFNRLYHMERLCRAVERVKREGQLLDVGCATGNFLDRMRRRGNWRVYGVEVNEEAAHYAQDRFGLDVFVGELGAAGYPEHSFDIVTLWNVMEHLHSPLDTLKEVWQLLKDDGVLILSVPNVDSLDARIFGDRWIGLDPPRHLYVFSPETVSQLLSKAGFEVIDTRFIMGSYHSFTSSLRLAVSDSALPGPGKATLERIAVSLPTHVLLLPYLRATEWLRRGAILTVYARKTPRPGAP